MNTKLQDHCRQKISFGVPIKIVPPILRNQLMFDNKIFNDFIKITFRFYSLPKSQDDTLTVTLPSSYKLTDFQWFGVYDHCHKVHIVSCVKLFYDFIMLRF